MLGAIDNKKALAALKRYFFLLEKTGYVKSVTVRKYLVYLFALDFVMYMFPYMDEEDYTMIDRLLKRTFTNGGCLLPYKTACAKRVTLGMPWYMGGMKVRATEIQRKDRSTENDYLRTP